MTAEASKLNAAAALLGVSLNSSKLNAAAALVGVGANVSKLNAYAVLTTVGVAQVSKLNAYAVLGPPPPISIVLAATEPRDIASITFLAPVTITLAATEPMDVAAFNIANDFTIALAATERRDIASIKFAPFGFPALLAPGLGWSVHRRPTFDTIVATHQSGSEVRFALWSNALWEFELTFEGLAGDVASYPGLGVNSYQALMGMALTLGGTHDRFLYVDPDFNTLSNQQIGVGDGATTQFQLVRSVGGAVEPISWATGVSAVTVDGVAVPFSMPTPSIINILAAAPGSGAVIAASFNYGFLCRLLDDTEDFEEVMTNLWQLKSFKFRQVRE